MRAAIAIDSWKLPIFEEKLNGAGFQYEKHGGLTKDSLTLIVETDDDGMPTLAKVVATANTEAAKRRRMQ